jgi:hypothetical protein
VGSLRTRHSFSHVAPCWRRWFLDLRQVLTETCGTFLCARPAAPNWPPSLVHLAPPIVVCNPPVTDLAYPVVICTRCREWHSGHLHSAVVPFWIDGPRQKRSDSASPVIFTLLLPANPVVQLLCQISTSLEIRGTPVRPAPVASGSRCPFVAGTAKRETFNATGSL